MRTSSVRRAVPSTTARRRFGRRPGLALVLLATLDSACGSEAPAPQKIEHVSPFARDQHPPRVSDPNDPLRNPAYEAPLGPDGPQLPEAELDATLAEAAELAAAGDVTQARNVLRKCANKTPASARCDGRMGLSLIATKNRRAAALYHLLAAAAVDDPKADGQLYLEIGEALRQHGKLDQAVVALQLAVAREGSAAHIFALGQALSLLPDRLLEAADRMAEARAQDDRIEWLLDEAVVRGQIPAREQAEASLALFRQYTARNPDSAEQYELRIAELESMAKQYPPQAEWERQQALAAGGPPPDTSATTNSTPSPNSPGTAPPAASTPAPGTPAAGTGGPT